MNELEVCELKDIIIISIIFIHSFLQFLIFVTENEYKSLSQ
jgi:hypothetical protein